MKNNVVLYNIKKENGDSFSLNAYIDQSSLKLVLEGQDFSKTAKQMFNEEEYEYYYSFSKEEVEKLKIALKNTDVLAAISNFFAGKMVNNEFLEFCKNNNIKYETYVV